jgi:uncharacterized membrane protein
MTPSSSVGPSDASTALRDQRLVMVGGFDVLDLAAVAVTAAVAVAVATGERSAFRTVVAIIFALYVPGRAVVSNWPGLAARSHIGLSILFSLSILTLLATVTLWLGYWRPLGLLEVECAIVGVALFTALWRKRSHQSRPESTSADAGAADLHQIES